MVNQYIIYLSEDYSCYRRLISFYRFGNKFSEFIKKNLLMVIFILRDKYGYSDSIYSRAKITYYGKMLLTFRKELLGVYL